MNKEAFGQWISVKERLPDCCRICLIYTTQLDGIINTALWHPGKRKWLCGDNSNDITHKVTHWMPLPEPPGEIREYSDKSVVGLIPEEKAKEVLRDAYRAVEYGFRGQPSPEPSKGEKAPSPKDPGARIDALQSAMYSNFVDICDDFSKVNQRIDALQDKLAAINNIIHSTSPFASHSDLKMLEEKIKDDHDNIVILEEHIRDLKSTLLKGIETLISKSL